MAKRPRPEPIYELQVDPSYLETPEFRLLVEALLTIADEELAGEREAEESHARSEVEGVA